MKITRCANDPYGAVAAQLVITNSDSKPSSYSVTVAFERPDGSQVATGYVNVDQLQPGQVTAPQDAVTGQPADGRFTCQVANVIRFPSA